MSRIVFVFAGSLIAVTCGWTTSSNAMGLMTLGDSIAEGSCANGTTTADCDNPYNYGTNGTKYNNYTTTPDFCTTFAQQMVGNYNPGNDKGGFRGPLLTKLRAAGTTVTMKGHVSSGSALAPADRAHEGHGSWFAEQVAWCSNNRTGYTGYIALQNPDAIVLQVGTNDVRVNRPAATTASTINSIRAAAGSRRVLVATVPPYYRSTTTTARDSTFETLRSDVNTKVADLSNQDYPCTARNLPDMGVLERSEMNVGDPYGVHPNNAGYQRMAEILTSSLLAPECRFDTRTFVTINGVQLESITAYGRYWNYPVNGASPEKGPLNVPGSAPLARYNAICKTHPVCTLDTRVFIDGPSGVQESITAFNRIYNYSSAGALQSSSALRSVSRYNTYICTYASPDTCVFDTRAIRSGSVETITAYGRYFEFSQSTGAYIGSGPLASVPRYARICTRKPASQTYCTFDTRTFVQLPGEANLESITAYGYYWNFSAETGALLESGPLSSVARYKHP